MRLLLKGLTGMVMAWLVIYFGMKLFFLTDQIHPALRTLVMLGMLFMLIMIPCVICGSFLRKRQK
ncbi:hypothetical protein FQF29_10050 [Escherichia coli]|uniref:Uncharacterized protein n=1 Tax=Escherichia coli TaxID=562 RepID=A0A5E9ST55_ECOLX|nr:hypothetical protein [Escherichia coli]EFB6607529.1 hypothetical protein [Escherichia coli]EFC9748452.1 hypothetical protein [Escherichia coli]TEV83389.1 hypothetical protein E2127_24580 [Escherichia coli]HAI9883481.1 hypothetical protein [Escherichia coli]